MDDSLKSLYIDIPDWDDPVQVDDFIIAIGKKQSNSVYHVAEVKSIVPRKEMRFKRYYLKVLKSDLLTAIRRDPDQKIIPIYWYPRNKKK